MISSGEKLSAIPETMVLTSIPTSTLSCNNFLVLATFTASNMVPTLMSNFVKSSKSMVSFWGSTVLFSSSLAFLVAASFSNCTVTVLSSIF